VDAQMALVPQGISYPTNFLRQDNIFVDPLLNNLSSNNPAFPYAGLGAGAWTPVDASGAGLVFTSVSARYSVASNIVFINGRLTYPVTASGANAAIGGLPFPVANQLYAEVPFFALANVTEYLTYPTHGTSHFRFGQISGVAVTNANLSTFAVSFAFWYPLA
jgi:hypothetical protein